MTTKRRKVAEGVAQIIHPGDPSPFVDYLLQQFVEAKGFVDDAAGLRQLLDAELGDITLTGELFKMRSE